MADGAGAMSLLDKQIPSNLEAERATLGSLLMDRDAILTVAGWLTAADFYLPKHAWVYGAMLVCHVAHIPTDLQTVGEQLRIAGHLGEVGDIAFLADLSNSVPTAYHVEYYARIVEKTAILRRLIQAGGRIAAIGYDETDDADVAIGNAQAELNRVRQSHGGGGMATIGDAIDELYQEWESGVVPGVMTGLADLDRVLGGWQPGALLILGARPSIGKSAFAAQVSLNMAKRGERVLFFSLEMDKRGVTQRWVCQETGFDLTRLTRHDWSNAELANLLTAAGKCHELPIAIEDRSPQTINGIRSLIMSEIARNGKPAAIIVDYLQRVVGSVSYNGNRNNEVGEASKGLKALAMEVKCPILALAALGRAIEGRAGHMPTLSDLRESGDIEYDADVVMFIHREERYDRDSTQKGVAEIHIAKNRQGPLGIVPLYFDESSQRWRDPVLYASPGGY